MLEGLLAGLAVAAGAVAPPTPGLPVGPVQYGVNAQYLFATAPQDQWGRQLDAMRASGLKVVRQDAEWAGVEPSPPAGARHAYHWEKLDAIAGELAKHGLRWRPIVDYSAPWAATAEGNTKSPPRDDAAFAAYAGALAARYGAGGSFWRTHPSVPDLPVTTFEIWNEPDLPVFWQPGPDPARYAGLYLAARRAIKAADPGAQVIVGGLVRDPAGFVAAMLRARPDAARQLDGVAVHPYAADANRAMARVAQLRAALVRAGLRRLPIDVTELGWPTSGEGAAVPVLSDAVRARELTTAVALLARSGCGVRAVIPHTWATPERDGANPEDWFGMHHPDGKPTVTGIAYGAVVPWLERMPRPPRPAPC